MPARAPRTSIASPKGGAKGHAPARKSDARHSNGKFFTTAFQRWLIAAFLLAPVLALCIQITRPPEDPAVRHSTVKPRVIAPLIAGSLASPQATLLEFGAEEINAHLAQVLPTASKKGGELSYQSVAVQLEPERCHIRAVYLWRGVPLHLRISGSVSLQGGRLQFKAFSGSLGRIPLGLFWTRKLQEATVLKLLISLKKEQVLMKRLETLRMEPGRVLLKVRASTPEPGS